MKSAGKKKSTAPVIGWREWVSLPELGVRRIKAKIDTGARSSSLHAFDVETFRRRGKTWVRFRVHPLQRTAHKTVTAEAEVVARRRVKASSGHATLRPAIVTEVELLGRRWPIELTLANRDAMSFRMLLGREATRGRFMVDPGRSYYGGKPVRAARSAAKKESAGAGRKASGAGRTASGPSRSGRSAD